MEENGNGFVGEKDINRKMLEEYGNVDELYRTETEMSSFWWHFHHWLHWKLSFWQLSVQLVMKISSKWQHFRFSALLRGFL